MQASPAYKILTTQPPGSDEFKSAHRGKLGGSAVADVLGLGRISPLRRWAILTEKVEPEDISHLPFIEFGNRVEPIACEWWTDKTGLQLAPPIGTLQHPTIPYLVGTPDRMILEDEKTPPGVLEAKTTHGMFRKDWEEDVPIKHRIQLHVYLAITGLSWGSFAATCGNEFLYKHDHLNVVFLDWMLTELQDWYDKYVVRDIQPPATDGEDVRRTIRQLHPKDNGRTIVLPGKFVDSIDEILQRKEERKHLDERIEQLENELCQELGDNTFGVAGSYEASWKHQSRKAYSVEASETRVLRIKKGK